EFRRVLSRSHSEMADTSGTFDGFLSSPRNQRRLFIFSAAVLVAGVGAFLGIVVFRGTGNAFTDTFSNKPAQLSHPEKTVPVSTAQYSLARRFIHTAVSRENLNAAYDLVDPDLKGALTRSQWNKGDIPVVTYQAVNIDRAAFVVDYSYKTQALMEI